MVCNTVFTYDLEILKTLVFFRGLIYVVGKKQIVFLVRKKWCHTVITYTIETENTQAHDKTIQVNYSHRKEI